MFFNNKQTKKRPKLGNVGLIRDQWYVPDWPRCRNADAGLTKLTAGLTFSGFPAFTYSSKVSWISSWLVCSATKTSWVTLHPTELNCNLLSNPVPFWTALSYRAIVRCWVTMHSPELCCTLLSYAAFYWAMLHPTELRWTLLNYVVPLELRCPSELRCTLWATLRPSEPSCTLLSSAAHCSATLLWAMLHPSGLSCTLRARLNPTELGCTLLCYASP